ncbi:hypothetical protein ACE103_06380 [Bradyrhizobium sp. ma5]|uniref:hypothetical protein n=1 Tax=unclassified Bradyrhizobium TaxID=2631580 RepID=UPI001CC5AEB7|nr:hypothetical protein [Bradyrhizobium sp. RD5-C2]GIQ73947.1 hypothetical protein BraRD5C2_23850 [Bradyrhizobium sp. RD5-C2]
MEVIRSIVARFPRRELDIRRCFNRDAQFRAVCADYDEAMKALRRWQQAARQNDPEAGPRAADYERLVGELEEEVLAHLNGP